MIYSGSCRLKRFVLHPENLNNHCKMPRLPWPFFKMRARRREDLSLPMLTRRHCAFSLASIQSLRPQHNDYSCQSIVKIKGLKCSFTPVPKAGPMEGTPLLRLFLPRLGFTRYLMQRSLLINSSISRLHSGADSSM